MNGLRSAPPRSGADHQHDFDRLFARHEATVRAVARRHRLSAADQEDVAARTWLALVEHIGAVREPAAIGGWLATTARRECLRVIDARRREIPCDGLFADAGSDPYTVSDAVEGAERTAAVRGAVDRLPTRQRRLMRLLLDQPALSYDEVSDALKMPRGSVGPIRGRSLARLRRDHDLELALAG